MQRIAVIPSYEPDDRMINLLKELQDSFDIIVVNDGSGKKYQDIFLEAKRYATVLMHEKNKGKGQALKTAYKYIKENYQSAVIVSMDCDGQHRVVDAIKLCDYVENNSNTLILGKRLRDEKVPIRSRIGNEITRFIYRLITKIDVYDTQTGLRAFSSSLLDFLLSVEGDRFEYEMNVLLECTRRNIPIKEIEISTIYINNNSNSHFSTIKDSYLVYKQILKFSCSSLISFFIDYILYIIFGLVFNVFTANILARIFSSTFNYTVNKNLVFKSNKNIKISLFQYYVLAFVILLLNTLILFILINYLAFNKYIAKIVVEIILFILSFSIQKKVIFKNEK